MGAPFFSIVTCTYNSEEFIEKNILSVKEQKFNDYEHILIDGNSTDNTIKKLQGYQNESSDKVKLYSLEPKGISNAFNKGIEEENGEYILHLNSDDSFYNDHVLEEAFKFLNTDKQLDWIYGKINVINESEKSIGFYPNKNIYKRESKNWLGKYILKFINYIPHQAVFIKKDIFESYGYFDETLSSKMDPDPWLKIRNQTYWEYFNVTVSNFMLREGAMTSSKKMLSENRKNLVLVQKRYLNKVEMFFARIFNYISDIKYMKLIDRN